LLMHPEAIDSPFFKLVPSILLYPMIALATAAAVIASQAVISGAFSMTREAMSLGYSMRMPIVHTSREMSGQIFVPWVNNFLLLMVLFAVLHFGSSEKLSAAYGIAVTGTMSITTVLALVVARRQWHWKLPAVIAAGVLFLVIDLSFFGANLIKVEYGGWFPLVLGLAVFTWMTTWRRASRRCASTRRCACRARRCSSPRTRMRCRMRCCTTSSTTRCCMSATCC